MSLPEFLRRIKEVDTEESMELFKQYPELAQQCAEQIEKMLDDHTVPALHPRENLLFVCR